MVLITGASGKTGKAVIRALAARGEMVRAFVWREEQVETVTAWGVYDVVVGDLRDAMAVQRAMDGVRTAYHICPNLQPDEVAIGQMAISAALSAGVVHFVYHSVLHPQTQAMPHHWNKLQVESALMASGLPFTILQPAVYMQNILGSWESIVADGLYRVPYPVETRLSLVDLEDVAEAAANVLTELGHTRATYELVGTRALTQLEIAEILSQRLGRPVRAEAQPLETWAAGVRQAGLGEYQVETLIKMFHYYEHYGLWGNTNALGWLLRRSPNTFPVFVERLAREAPDHRAT